MLSLGDAAHVWYPLIEVNGNVGSPDFGPSDPFFTEFGLSTIGKAWFDFEPGQPVWPIGLCNGESEPGGAPPLDPTRVSALVAGAQSGKPTLSDAIGLLGPPSYPTGCEVEGDLERLYSGYRTELLLRPRVVLGETQRDHAGSETRAVSIRSMPVTLPMRALISLIETVALELWGSDGPHFECQDPSGPDARTRHLEIVGLDPAGAAGLERALRASQTLGVTQWAEFQGPIVEVVSGWLSGPGQGFDEARGVC